MAAVYGRENVYDFSLGNPNVPVPQVPIHRELFLFSYIFWSACFMMTDSEISMFSRTIPPTAAMNTVPTAIPITAFFFVFCAL